MRTAGQPRRPSGQWDFKPAADQPAPGGGLTLGGGRRHSRPEPAKTATLKAPTIRQDADSCEWDAPFRIGWHEDTLQWEPDRTQAFQMSLMSAGDDDAMRKTEAAKRSARIVCDMANSGDIDPSDTRDAWLAFSGALCGSMLDAQYDTSVRCIQDAERKTADVKFL